MKVRNLPWGRCSKAIRNGCKNPCGHYMAHHMVPYGDCWCHCEVIERPPEFKSWAAYNRMLMLRLRVEGAHLRNYYHFDRELGKSVLAGQRLTSRPNTHSNEKEFEHLGLRY